MAVIDVDAWVPEQEGSEVLRKVNQESAVESYARRIPMASNTRTVNRSGGTDVAVVEKSGTYGEAADTLDEIVLTARKFGRIFRIAEEDLNDSLPDVLTNLRLDWGGAFAKMYDNACLGVTAVGNGTTVPYNSVYYEVANNASANLVQAATGVDVSYANLSETLAKHEQSEYFDEANVLIVAHPAFKQTFREILDDQNRPIFLERTDGTPSTLFGYEVRFSHGAKTNATASASPSGNNLMVVGNRQFLLNGVRSGPESMVSTDASFDTDEPLLKVRARRGFAVGRPEAFAVLEDIV